MIEHFTIRLALPHCLALYSNASPSKQLRTLACFINNTNIKKERKKIYAVKRHNGNQATAQ